MCDPYESAANETAEEKGYICESKALLRSIPSARNTFVIVPVNKEDNLKDEDRLLRWEVLFQHSCLPSFTQKTRR